MEVLKQPQYSPYSMADMVIILSLSVGGHLLDVDVAKVSGFVEDFIAYLKIHNPDIPESIEQTGELPAEVEERLVSAIESFKASRLEKK
jgi:F-type H+-transporting ATPase subunit alpha